MTSDKPDNFLLFSNSKKSERDRLIRHGRQAVNVSLSLLSYSVYALLRLRRTLDGDRV